MKRRRFLPQRSLLMMNLVIIGLPHIRKKRANLYTIRMIWAAIMRRNFLPQRSLLMMNLVIIGLPHVRKKKANLNLIRMI
jgi:hypothetical protein